MKSSDSNNTRNGSSRKNLQTDGGQFELEAPRDQAGSFEPKLVKNHQRRFTSMDDKILFLYAQDMSTRDIVQTFKEMHDSARLITKVTNAVIEQMIDWQARPLDTVYPDAQIQLCIVHMIRNSLKYVPWKDDKEVTANLKAIYGSTTEEDALQELNKFSEKWDEKYPQISRS